MGQLHTRLSISGQQSSTSKKAERRKKNPKAKAPSSTSKSKRKEDPSSPHLNTKMTKPKAKSSKAGKGKRTTAESLDLAAYDHQRHCPRYSRLLEMDPSEDALANEDLDILQAELETLLLSNAERQWRMVKALEAMAPGDHPWADRIGDTEEAEASIIDAPSQPLSKLKLKIPVVSNGVSERQSKAVAREQIAAEAAGEENLVGSSSGFQPVPMTDRRGRKRIYFWPQNHMPDKFWAFVETYTAAITEENIKFLKDLIRDNTAEKNRKYFQLHPDVWTSKASKSNGSSHASQSNTSARKGAKRRLESPEPSDGSDVERKPAPIKCERKSRRLSSATGMNGSSTVANGDASHSLGPLTG